MNMKRLFLLPLLLLALVQPVFAAAPPVTVLSDLITKGPWLDARAYKTLTAADAAAVAAGKLLVISSQWNTVPATLNASVRILPGGKLNSSGTVTINGAFAGADGCFGASQTVIGVKLPRPEMWTINTTPGTTDMTSALSSAFTCALISKGEVVLAGDYLITSTIAVSPNMSGSLYTYGTLKITGSGLNHTSIISSVSNAPALWIKSGQYDISGVTFRAADSAVNPVGLRLGDNAGNTPVAQSSIYDVKFLYFYKAVQIEFAWDSSFTRVGCFNGKSGGTHVELTAVTSDNTNNIAFYNCHLENISGGKLFHSVGGISPNQYIAFNDCHLETVNRSTSAVHLEGTRFVTFTGCNIMQNGSDAASGRVPLIYMSGVYGVNFYGGSIITTALSTASKLIKVAGTGAIVSFNNVYFTDTSNGETIAGLIDTTTSVDSTGAGVEFKSVQLNDSNRVKLSSNSSVIGAATARFKQVAIAGNKLATYFDNASSYSATSWPNPPLEITGVYGSKSRGLPISIATGAYADFDVENTTLPNGPAMLVVMADTPGATAGTFWKRGTSVVAVSALADIVASAAPAAGKFGVSAPSATVFRVHNNYGSTRDVTVFVMGAQ